MYHAAGEDVMIELSDEYANAEIVSSDGKHLNFKCLKIDGDHIEMMQEMIKEGRLKNLESLVIGTVDDSTLSKVRFKDKYVSKTEVVRLIKTVMNRLTEIYQISNLSRFWKRPLIFQSFHPESNIHYYELSDVA